MKITLEMEGLPELVGNLAEQDKRVQVAGTRAIRSTLLYVQSLVKKDAAAELKVPQSAMIKRLRISKIRNGDQSGRFWAGTWNLSPYVFGSPAQTQTGVFDARGGQYAGAFLKSIFGGKENIWIRLRSRYFDPKLYPGARKKAGTSSLDPEMRGKFPVAKAAIEIVEAVEKVFERDEADIRFEFDKRLRAEINFALNVEGSR